MRKMPQAIPQAQGFKEAVIGREGSVSFILPLPPSKNAQHIFGNGRVYLDSKVKDYYNEVYRIVKYYLRLDKIFTEKKKIVIWCNWFVRRKGIDAVNFHNCLADALKSPLEIDDQHFLIRDYDIQKDKENPRVEIEMIYLE